MGSSGYSGKGSSSYSSYSYTEPVKKEKSPMEDMLRLLGVVEQNRRNVTQKRNAVSSAQRVLVEAESELKSSEQKVMMQLEKLDPETRQTLTRMMDGLNRGTNGNIIRRDER